MSLLGNLKSAVCDKLRSETSVTNLLGEGERIFDIPPRYTPEQMADAAPYIYIGAEGGQMEWQRGHELQFNVRIRIYVVTDDGDRNNAHDIAEAVAITLQHKPLNLSPGHSCSDPYVENMGDVIDPMEAQMVFIDLRTIAAKEA